MVEWDDVIPIYVRPNWRRAYTVSREFKTAIYSAQSGDEQRKALRSRPRITIEFEAMLRGQGLRAFNATRLFRRDVRYWIPYIPETASVMVEGGVVEYFDDTPDWVKSGAKVFLSQRATTFFGEYSWSGFDLLVTSDDVIPDGLYRAAPGRKAYIESDNDLAYETTTVATGTLAFSLEIEGPGMRDVDIWLREENPLFRNFGVFAKKPNWANNIRQTLKTPVDMLDYGTGIVSYFYERLFNNQLMEQTFVGRKRAEVAEIENFFDAMRGSARRFYMPTFVEDIKLADAALVGRDAKLAYATDFLSDEIDYVNRTTAFIRDKVVVPLGIDRLYTTGADRYVRFDQNFADAGVPEGGFISYLRMCRFASDKLVVEWLTDEVAQVKFSTVSLREAFNEINIAGHRMTIGGDYIIIPDPAEAQADATLEGDVMTISGYLFTIGGDTVTVSTT